MDLPEPIIWTVAISIIIIAFAILLRLVVYLVAGKIFLSKISQLTTSIDSLIETLKDKTEDIGNQASATLEGINKKICSSEDEKKETRKWMDITNKAIAVGTIVFNFVKMFKKSNGGIS